MLLYTKAPLLMSSAYMCAQQASGLDCMGQIAENLHPCRLDSVKVRDEKQEVESERGWRAD